MKSFLYLILPLLLLAACEMQSIQNRNPQVNPKFVGTSRLNEETGKYEVEVSWQGLGEMSYEVHRKTIESDPYNYGGGGIRVVRKGKVFTSNTTENVFIDTDVQSRLVYEYELLDSDTRTFRVGPIQVYVYEDRVITDSLSDQLVIGGEDNRFGRLHIKGEVKVQNWRGISARELVFEPGSRLVFGNHLTKEEKEKNGDTEYCGFRHLRAERAMGKVEISGVDSQCVAMGKTFRGNSFFLHITAESPVSFSYGKGVTDSELPAYAQCILVGTRKVLWGDRCDRILQKGSPE